MKTRFFHIFHPPGEKCEKTEFSSKFTILQIFPNFAKIQKNVKNCSNTKFKILKSSHSKKFFLDFFQECNDFILVTNDYDIGTSKFYILMLRRVRTRQSVESS